MKRQKDVMLQTSVRLPEDLRERLKDAAKERGSGIDPEIRRRLEESFMTEGPTGDLRLRALLADVRRAGDMLASYREFQGEAWAYKALEKAVAAILKHYRPPAETKAKPVLASAAFDLLGDQKPEAVGLTVAAMVLGQAKRG